MTEKDFVIWLHGVIDCIKATGSEPTIETINLIEKVMQNIKKEESKQLLRS